MIKQMQGAFYSVTFQRILHEQGSGSSWLGAPSRIPDSSHSAVFCNLLRKNFKHHWHEYKWSRYINRTEMMKNRFMFKRQEESMFSVEACIILLCRSVKGERNPRTPHNRIKMLSSILKAFQSNLVEAVSVSASKDSCQTNYWQQIWLLTKIDTVYGKKLFYASSCFDH